MRTLYVKIIDPTNEVLRRYWTEYATRTGYEGDSGVDLCTPTAATCETGVTMVGMGVSCRLVGDGERLPYLLMARSSISKKPLMLANGVGLIDAGYTGEIIAPFRLFSDRGSKYTIEAGDRLVQLVAFDGQPMKVVIVDDQPDTERGDRGFGSTGGN